MARRHKLDLARAICALAVEGGMPDSYWETDSRIALAREVLGADEVEEWKQGLRDWEPPDGT